MTPDRKPLFLRSNTSSIRGGYAEVKLPAQVQQHMWRILCASNQISTAQPIHLNSLSGEHIKIKAENISRRQGLSFNLLDEQENHHKNTGSTTHKESVAKLTTKLSELHPLRWVSFSNVPKNPKLQMTIKNFRENYSLCQLVYSNGHTGYLLHDHNNVLEKKLLTLNKDLAFLLEQPSSAISPTELEQIDNQRFAYDQLPHQYGIKSKFSERRSSRMLFMLAISRANALLPKTGINVLERINGFLDYKHSCTSCEKATRDYIANFADKIKLMTMHAKMEKLMTANPEPRRENLSIPRKLTQQIQSLQKEISSLKQELNGIKAYTTTYQEAAMAILMDLQKAQENNDPATSRDLSLSILSLLATPAKNRSSNDSASKTSSHPSRQK